MTHILCQILTVVQTRTILFSKSMSEKVGSDMKRLWIWMMNFWIESKSIEYLNSESFYVSSDFFRHCFEKMKWLGPGLPWPNFYRIVRLITSLGPRRTGPRTLKIQIFNNCKNKIFIFCKDSSWEQTNEPIELKPPSSIDDVIKPVQPNPYNSIIPESTHSSNVSFTVSKHSEPQT